MQHLFCFIYNQNWLFECTRAKAIWGTTWMGAERHWTFFLGQFKKVSPFSNCLKEIFKIIILLHNNTSVQLPVLLLWTRSDVFSGFLGTENGYTSLYCPLYSPSQNLLVRILNLSPNSFCSPSSSLNSPLLTCTRKSSHGCTTYSLYVKQNMMLSLMLRCRGLNNSVMHFLTNVVFLESCLLRKITSFKWR